MHPEPVILITARELSETAREISETARAKITFIYYKVHVLNFSSKHLARYLLVVIDRLSDFPTLAVWPREVNSAYLLLVYFAGVYDETTIHKFSLTSFTSTRYFKICK